MGMFDNLIVEYPMPDPKFQNRFFQTKDTPAQWLDIYKISREGRLLYENYTSYIVPEKDRPGWKDYQRTKDNIYLGWGMLGKKDKKWVDTNFNGNLEFYDWIKERDTDSGLARWKASFTHGKLQRITRIITEPPWREYPDYSMGCMGWRMGSGEDYIDDWIKWYKGLTSKEREEYRNKYPEPKKWKGFYGQFPT